MTVVGKILVFLNLVFSLLVGGLVMMAYSSRENWVQAHKEERALRQAIEKSRDQIFTEKRTLEQKLTNDLQAEREKATGLQGKLAQAETQLATLKDKLSETSKAIEKADANTKTTQGASASREQEVRELETSLAMAQDEIKNLNIQMNTERADKVRAQIDAKTLQARLGEMEGELKRLARELAKKSIAGTDTTTTVSTQPNGRLDSKNPPPQDLEGQVTAVDAESGLVSIKPGSDSGLQRGHTMEVFRLGENPKYLGRIRIEGVRPHEAVGRPVKKTPFAIKVGDRVASRIQVGR